MSDDTATIERDLEAIETALGSGSATHADPASRALQELALTLAADAPAPRPELVEQLGRRVEEGFQRPPKPNPPAPFAHPPQGLAPLPRVAAAILVVVC